MVSTGNDKEILYCNFNQDQSCIAVGTQNGFKIFSTNPFSETFSRELGGGIGIVEMLFKCNILALVGGGESPKFPKNKVMLWDDHQSKCIAELAFRTDVKGLRLKADKIIVVLDNKLYVYNFSDIKLIDHIETVKNPKGLFSLNNDPQTTVLACLAKEVGHVAIIAYDTKKTISFRAHQSQIGNMELDHSGKKLATSSEKGTIIRIFSTEEGTLIHEVRRGSEYAQISSISFDTSSKWLACCSDTCTIHIFGLKDTKNPDVDIKEKVKEKVEEVAAKNQKSKFSFMKVVSSYFNSEWSFAQYKIPDRKATLAFGQDPHTIHILGFEGGFYTISYDPINGGECMKQFEGKIFDSAN